MPTQERIVVALSGGVDSATAAALLLEQGHEVIGMTMRLYDAGGTGASSGGRCCGPRDIEDARRVCAHLGIPFYVVNYEREFRAAVVDDFVAEYVAGRTPNPCVRCNESLKFGPLLARATAVGASRLATGHYARLEDGPDGRRRLLRAVDAGKDQSYFLFAMPSLDLDRVLFPLGDMTKEEVRAKAEAFGLPNATKPDSQEICFVPDGDHMGFVERNTPIPPEGGEIVDGEGKVLAQHEGVHRFTVGQRRGLGASLGQGEPRYVVGIDALRRRVTVGPREAVGQREVQVKDVRWLGGRPHGEDEVRAQVQVRHRHRPSPARLVTDGEGVRVTFDAPEWGVAPGQVAVFYDGPVVLGGGWIQ